MANTDPCLYMESLLDPATQADTGVRVMTLNRPDTLNSLTPEMADAFTQALQQLQDDQHKRVLVITGKGRAFSAGGDFSFIEERIQGEHSDNVRVSLQEVQGSCTD
jgi:enoyl-CoA hydratase/carnithine racemase